MTGNVFTSQHPLVKHKLSILRDRETSPKVFRELVGELSALLAYEATQDLSLKSIQTQTPLTTIEGQALEERVGLIPILRAGLGMVDGILQLLPAAEVWHIGLYRDEETFEPIHYYNKLPDEPTVSLCLILDPMLATGGSAVATVDALKAWGVKKIKYIGIIGAPEGVQNLTEHHPDVPIYLAALDDHLNEFAFIVPGLGDAGDRQFGTR